MDQSSLHLLTFFTGQFQRTSSSSAFHVVDNMPSVSCLVQDVGARSQAIRIPRREPRPRTARAHCRSFLPRAASRPRTPRAPRNLRAPALRPFPSRRVGCCHAARSSSRRNAAPAVCGMSMRTSAQGQDAGLLSSSSAVALQSALPAYPATCARDTQLADHQRRTDLDAP
jgi:hypothetical protein